MQVGGFDVPVHDPGAVRGVQARGGLAHEMARLRHAVPAPVEQLLGQAAAAEQLHHQVGPRVLLAHVEHGDHVRVHHAGGGAGLTGEALPRGDPGDLRREDLHRHGAVGPQVPAPPDLAHPAPADQLLQLVTTAERGRHHSRTSPWPLAPR